MYYINQQFNLKKQIGYGAASQVFLIEDYKTREQFALKCIPKKSENYKNNSHRIANECKLHSELNHTNIVRMYECFEDSDNIYMRMEYCPGGNLFNYLKNRGQLSELEVKNITYQIVCGLEYLHSNKVIHRDLKPGNIVLTDNALVKICDFGLAVRLEDFASELQTFCGTPNYIAPEICSRGPYGIKSDCWSFGCILFTLAIGRPPFDGVNIQETFQTLMKKKKVKIPSHLSKELSDLLEHTLERDCESRYSILQIKHHPFYQGRNSSSQSQERSKKFISSEISDKQVKRKANTSLDLGSNLNKENINPNIPRTSTNKQSPHIFSQNYRQSNDSNQRSNMEQLDNKTNNVVFSSSHIQPKIIQTRSSSGYAKKLNGVSDLELNGSSFINKETKSRSITQIVSPTGNQVISYDINESLNRQLNCPSNSQKQSISFKEQPTKNEKSVPKQTVLSTLLMKSVKSNSLHQSKNSISNNNSFFQSQNPSNSFQASNTINNKINEASSAQAPSQRQLTTQDLEKEWTLDPKNTQILCKPNNQQNQTQQRENINVTQSTSTHQKTRSLNREIEISNDSKPNMLSSTINNNSSINKNSSKIIFSNQVLNQSVSPSQANNSKNNIEPTQSTKHYSTTPGFFESNKITRNKELQQQPQISQNINYNNPFSTSQTQQILSSTITQNNGKQKMRSLSTYSSQPEKCKLELDNSLQNNYLSLSRENSNTNTSYQKDHSATIITNRSKEGSQQSYRLPPTPSGTARTSSSTYRTDMANHSPVSSLPQPQSNRWNLEYSKTEPNEQEAVKLQKQNRNIRSNSNCNKNEQINEYVKNSSKALNQSNSFGAFVQDSNQNTKNLSHQPKRVLSPVKVEEDFEVAKIQTKNGFIEITKDRSLLFESCNGKLLFEISKDGIKINIVKLLDKPSQKSYILDRLPEKYHALYYYAKEVIEALKAKKIVSKLENNEGVFTLLKNDSFEAIFKNGYRVNMKGNDLRLTLKTPESQIIYIHPSNPSSQCSIEAKNIASKAMKYYNYLSQQKSETQCV